ncbi:MAG TPA: trigger factor [Acidimicrobiia bacterium]|nr:trigger factor [Acidimicrobiia bacterium]
MTQTVREMSRFERLVTLELSDADINAAKAAAARRLSKDLRIPGFRPGKAPRPVVEAAIGPERLRTEAIEDLIPARLGTLLEEAELNPAVTPTLEKVDEVAGGVNVEVMVTLWPTVDELPSYAGREITVSDPTLSDEELEASITRMREQFANLETVERPAGEGDFVAVDIHAERDGEAVEEASAADLLYEIGSGLLITGADEHLLGTAAGDEVSFSAPLPAGFGDRAGLEAKFTIKVNEVKAKVLPELNDDWVDEATEFESVVELREALTAMLARAKEQSVANRFREQALDQLVDEVEIDLPERIVESEMETVLHRFIHRLEGDEISLDDYLKVTGQNEEEFLSDVRLQAEHNLRTRLVLEAVVRQENLQLDPQEVTGTIELMVRQSENPEEIRRAFREQARVLALAGDILRSKAMEVVVAAAKAVDGEGNPVNLAFSQSTGVVEGISGEVEAELVEEQLEAAQIEAEVEAEVVEAEVIGDEEA